MKKTKIMAIGDIHGDTGLVKKLAKMAKDEKVDIIILPGDLTWLEQSTKNLIGPFIKENKIIISIFLLALSIRILFVFVMPIKLWDETVYTNLGYDLSKNLFQYFLQSFRYKFLSLSFLKNP